jgi:hypothetical protein
MLYSDISTGGGKHTSDILLWLGGGLPACRALGHKPISPCQSAGTTT